MKAALLSILLTIALAVPFQSKAQDRSFEVKNSLLGFSAGFGWTKSYYQDPSVWPTLALTYEKGLSYMSGWGYLSFSLMGGYQRADYDFPSSNHYIRWQNAIGTLRLNYHPVFLMTQHFDFYISLVGGARYEFFKDTEYDANPSSLIFNPYKRYGGLFAVYGGYVGMRIYPGERLGFFVEGGYAYNYLNIGINWKFGDRNIKADPDIIKRGTRGPRF